MSLMELLTCLYLRSNIFLMELTFGSSETACFIVTEKIDIINAICIDVGKQQFRVFFQYIKYLVHSGIASCS